MLYSASILLFSNTVPGICVKQGRLDLKLCGDIVCMISLVYVVALNSRKILLINPPMGWGSKTGTVMCGGNTPIVI
jgi:hypothetical protein